MNGPYPGQWRALRTVLLVGPVQALAGTPHQSGIDKHPVATPLWLGSTGFSGDGQADLGHHGGPDKAVHHYAFDHYADWRDLIGARPVLLRPGAFGENLSTSGCTEADVCIGDVFALGRTLLQVSQARQPCWKLKLRFGHSKMSALVQQSGRTGWYYRVLQTGWVEPGDELALVERRYPEWPLARVLDVLYRRTLDAPCRSSMPSRRPGAGCLPAGSNRARSRTGRGGWTAGRNEVAGPGYINMMSYCSCW